jgi:pseudouridine-5'-phosphate glycosidase
LDTALKSAECQNISGRNLTPFLLSSMAQASEGETLKANIALLKNNARVAAGIAGALANASVA